MTYYNYLLSDINSNVLNFDIDNQGGFLIMGFLAVFILIFVWKLFEKE